MSRSAILAGAAEILAQGQALLRALDAATYAAHLPQACNASIGSHYRHCLDQFESVLEGVDRSELIYERRRDDPRLECDPLHALAQTARILHGVESIPDFWLPRILRVRVKVSYAAPESPFAVSTIGREIACAIGSGMNHFAWIRVLCGFAGVETPRDFGAAPVALGQAPTLALPQPCCAH